MKVYAMTLVHATKAYIVHGEPMRRALAASFVGVRRYQSVLTHTWAVDAWKPHLCDVTNCPARAAYGRAAWRRVAHKAVLRQAALVTLRRALPLELVELVLSVVYEHARERDQRRGEGHDEHHEPE